MGLTPHDHLGPCPRGRRPQWRPYPPAPRSSWGSGHRRRPCPGQHRLEGGGVGGAAVHRQHGDGNVPALAIGLDHRQGLGAAAPETMTPVRFLSWHMNTASAAATAPS